MTERPDSWIRDRTKLFSIEPDDEHGEESKESATGREDTANALQDISVRAANPQSDFFGWFMHQKILFFRSSPIATD